MAENDGLRVLVVEDDPDARANLQDILELDDYRVDTAGSVAEALARDGWSEYAIVLTDRRLPDGTAEDLLPVLREKAPRAGVIVVTGYDDVQGAISALRLGAVDYILKPVDPDELLRRMGNIAERARAEERIRTLTSLPGENPNPILRVRGDGTLLYANPAAAVTLSAWDCETSGVIPDPWRGKVQDALQTGISREEEAECGGRVWSVLFTPVTGTDYVNIYYRDITEIKEAQERALQSERLAAIGQLIAVLAHESGNALANSQACLEMLCWEVEDQPEALDLITRIGKAQGRLRQLYEEVRSYAAPVKLDQEVWDLSGIWRQAWESLAGVRGDREACLHECTESMDLQCPVDAFRVEQVFRNLFENALAACPDPLRVEVCCAEATISDRAAVRVAVRDNGPGLGLEQRRRIFEPFFTTKSKGTGLGMAIAKRIIEAHGGRIEVGDRTAPGAEIVVTLPR